MSRCFREAQLTSGYTLHFCHETVDEDFFQALLLSASGAGLSKVEL